jgi:sugar/nucleoside kinase (ribokinase family)
LTVVVVGDIVTDILAVHSEPLAVGSDTPAHVTIGGGGSGANTAAWLAALGVPVIMVGVIGGDEAGDARLAELKAAGVRCAVRRAAQAATGSVVVISDGAERTMLCDRGANLLLAAADVDAALPEADHLHLSGYALLDERSRPAGRHALAAAVAAGITTSVDAASAAPLRRARDFLSWVRGTDLLFANLDEAAVLAGTGPAAELATRLASGVRNAVVKSGRAGAVWATAAAVPVHVPAIPTPMVDPTGAGDAFTAGVLAAWLGGRTRIDALLTGAEAGARAVSTVGGRPPM